MLKHRFLAVIPARAGSKGLPGKNTRLLAGKPLIRYTMDTAIEVFDKCDICVSTDDPLVIEIANEIGLDVPFTRPDYLATDNATSQDVIRHAFEYYKNQGVSYDAIVLLQPTSPLRRSQDIRGAVALFNSEIDMVVSVKETDSNPYYVLFEEDSNGYLKKSKEGNFTRRQDCPKVWEYNGAIYVINSRIYGSSDTKVDNIVKFVMSKDLSVDIDDQTDFQMAEYLLTNKTVI